MLTDLSLCVPAGTSEGGRGTVLSVDTKRLKQAGRRVLFLCNRFSVSITTFVFVRVLDNYVFHWGFPVDLWT